MSETDTRHDPDALLDEEAERDPDVAALAAGYDLVAECFVYPEALDREAMVETAASETIPRVARHVDEDAAEHFAAFVDAFDDVDTGEYVATLELDPACPLYLGHYVFEQPQTCRDIADADRNQYMVELAGIYEHFGFEIDDELPDFVPAMAEFLRLTLDQRDEPLRAEFASNLETMLPAMLDTFEEHETVYRYPLEALYRLVEYDVATSPADPADAPIDVEDGSDGGEPSPTANEGDNEEERSVVGNSGPAGTWGDR